MEDMKKKIEEYVGVILHMHDMSPWRNEGNQKRMDKIVSKCMSELEASDKLVKLLQNEKQIEYFVRQTILYMV